MSNPRVCVIGAGVAGLVTIKELKNVGLDPVCYELNSDLGGIWCSDRSGETSNSPWVWDNLITNTTKNVMTFSDFPYYPDTPQYITRADLGEYYRSYAEHFELIDHIQYNTRVLKVRKTPDHDSTGQWEVFTCPTSEFHNGDKRAGQSVSEEDLRRCGREVFDVVLVCSGVFKRPVYPNIPGLDSYRGIVKHSFDYKSGVPFKDMKVLVVGNSFSAGDIAVDVSQYTDKPVDLSIGQGTWISPRVTHGRLSADRTFSRHLLYDMSEDQVNNLLIESCQSRFDHFSAGVNPDKPPTRSPYMMGDDILLKILTDQIRFQDELVSLNDNTAEYKNGSKSPDINAVVFATGYGVDTSFIDEQLVFDQGRMELYNRMLPLGAKHQSLIFIGFLSGDGPVGPPTELQARYAAQLITGKLQPPTRALMEKNVQTLDAMALASRGKYSYHLPVFAIADMVATDLGAYPYFWKVFFRDPILAFRVWYGPMYSAHYRLLGPDSDWSKAREVCYRADQVKTSNATFRSPVKVKREDVTGLNRNQFLFVIGGTIGVAVALGYIGRSRNWFESPNFGGF